MLLLMVITRYVSVCYGREQLIERLRNVNGIGDWVMIAECNREDLTNFHIARMRNVCDRSEFQCSLLPEWDLAQADSSDDCL